MCRQGDLRPFKLRFRVPVLYRIERNEIINPFNCNNHMNAATLSIRGLHVAEGFYIQSNRWSLIRTKTIARRVRRMDQLHTRTKRNETDEWFYEISTYGFRIKKSQKKKVKNKLIMESYTVLTSIMKHFKIKTNQKLSDTYNRYSFILIN